MSIYQVSGIQADGLGFNLLIIPTKSVRVGAYWKEESQGYPALKRQLVSQGMINQADTIKNVEISLFRQPANIVEVEFNAKLVSESVCTIFAKKAVRCGSFALPIITAALLYTGNYYMNSGGVSGRLFEQLGL